MANNIELPTAADLQALLPEQHRLSNGNTLNLFRAPSVDIIKLDFIFEAGSAYQPKLLCAGLARDLFGETTSCHTAQQMAEYIDAHGIVVDRQMTTYTADISVYVLKKYAVEFMPLLREMFLDTRFGVEEFNVAVARRRQYLQVNSLKTSYMARNLFYRAIFGDSHPEGLYAMPGDEDKVALDDVIQFYNTYYDLNKARFSMSGNIDDTLLQAFDQAFATNLPPSVARPAFATPVANPADDKTLCYNIPSSVQSTIRLGFRLDYEMDSPEFSRFMVLNTVLGGYFGSRLMSSIREEKGYTYGINSAAIVSRHSRLFFITTDVNGAYVDAALADIYAEIDRLASEPIPDEELDTVRNYLAGDFLRSIDGIYERAERYNSMVTNRVFDGFTELYLNTLQTVSSAELLDIAQSQFGRGHFVQVIAGNVDTESNT